jgi:hypothetical protein
MGAPPRRARRSGHVFQIRRLLLRYGSSCSALSHDSESSEQLPGGAQQDSAFVRTSMSVDQRQIRHVRLAQVLARIANTDDLGIRCN